jgi:hypothetical protein
METSENIEYESDDQRETRYIIKEVFKTKDETYHYIYSLLHLNFKLRELL